MARFQKHTRPSLLAVTRQGDEAAPVMLML